MENIIFGFVVLVFVGGVLLLLFKRQKKLSKAEFQKYKKQIEATSKLDPNHAIMEAHKILVAAVGEFFSGKTAAKRLAKAQKFFPNVSQIWKFHGMRNKAAHETDFVVTSKQAEECRKEFVRALASISKKK